jgi:hypothetical protein
MRGSADQIPLVQGPSMPFGNGSVAHPDLAYKLFISFIEQGALIMAIHKVAKKVQKIEAGEMPAATSETPVAQPETAKPPSKRASKVVKLVPTLEVKPEVVPVVAPAKPRATRAAKPVIEPAAALEQAKVAEPAKAAKPAKIKHAKLVRDSFTMPEAEHAVIAGLKKRCLNLGVAAKKSEILRAALAVLARLNDADLATAIQGLAVIKTGRPAKGA